MKTIQHLSALFLSFSLVLTSCTTTSYQYAKTSGTRTPTKLMECSSTTKEEVTPFLAGDSIDFVYDQLGYVTAAAQANVSDSLVLNRLKYNSFLLCGNGVINIVKTELYDGDILKKQYSGIAVRIVKDSTFNNKHPYTGDYSFYDFATKDITSTTTETNAGATFVGLVAFTAGIYLWIKNAGEGNDNVFDEEDDYNYEDDWDEDDGFN